MRPFHHSAHSSFHSTQHPSDVLRVATYNIHKGVRGVGPRKRLEIHNLVLGIEALDTDLVFLQEVRRLNRAAARHFPGYPRRLAARPAGGLPRARRL
jgi:endonuclease/exonuclease/phosphatase family metal-dependent hydrolase